jgi:hypothetical protein
MGLFCMVSLMKLMGTVRMGAMRSSAYNVSVLRIAGASTSEVDRIAVGTTIGTRSALPFLRKWWGR